MKRLLSLGAAIALLSSAFAACTMDFDQFQASGGGGSGGSGGTGSCGECCIAADCPVPDDVCQAAACIDSVCSQVARADGTEVGTSIAGDCKKNVCQGGVQVVDDDDDDIDDDGNECTVDTCSAGMPQTMPEGAGAPCTDAGAVCDGMGDCVECLVDADCPPEAPTCDTAANQCLPATCTDNILNGAETDTDCGGGTCSPCADGDDCDTGTDCTSGVCGGNGKCSAPQCDDGVQNGGETDIDCGDVCSPNQCAAGQGCNDDNDCEGDECSGVGGQCVPNCNDDEMNNAETDVDCGGGTCDGCDIGDMCAGDDANCLSGNCGAGDLCAPKVVGAACMQNGECQSNQCEDGVCCATDCSGACRSCALAGDVGTCTNIAEGTDPANECAGAEVCDGMGACKKDAGQACGNTNECLLGLFCADGVCCDTPCPGLCQACNVAGSLGTCGDVPANQDPASECTGLTSCDGNGACNKLPNGMACTGPAECTSNLCVDGVCCATACAGTTCMACDIAGSLGTCTNVPNGQDPDNECPGVANCNGAAACN